MYRGIGSGKVRTRQPQEATHTDKKVQESKEDEAVFERDVVSKKEDNVIAETERTQPRGNRVVKSIKLSEDDKNHRSVNKTIQLVRDNKYSGRRESSNGQLGNRRDDQYGRKKKQRAYKSNRFVDSQ